MSTKKQRVLLMASSMRGGGSERQVLLLAQHLDRQRFDPHLFLTERVGGFLDQIPSDVTVHSFDAHETPPGLYLPGRQLRQQTQCLRSIIESAAIDVIYDRTFHMTLLAGKAPPNVRRVSTIVSPPDVALPHVEKRFVGLKKRRLTVAYRTADAVIAVSHAAAKSAEHYYALDRGQVIVVQNPVDVPALRRNLDSTPTMNDALATRLVCVGRMTSEKGHVDLLHALQQVVAAWPEQRKPLHVLLVGDGPLRSELETLTNSLRLSMHVEFCGVIDQAASVISSASALVLPSRFEGMPNVVLEAMALRTPVIATRSGGTVELQRDEPTAFWAAPTNPQSLAEAILEFANQPKRAARQVRAATELIHKHHDVAKTVRRIEDLLDPT